jgi:hypothetical protein
VSRDGSGGGRDAIARRRRVAALVGIAAALAGALHADVHQDRRIDAGLKIFRALLAADLDLERKTGEGGKLLVVFAYADDRKRAGELAARFGDDPIKTLPVIVEHAPHATFNEARAVPAGIFIAQPPGTAGLKTLVAYGIANRVIVYSPFEGHVESGVLGGLVVEAQVRPYVNLTTLAASSISLKEFFLKVTKVVK